MSDKKSHYRQTKKFSINISKNCIEIRCWLLKNDPMKTFIYSKVNVDVELTDVRQNGGKRQKGCTMNSQKVTKGKARALRNIDEGTENWLRSHNVQDMRDIVFEFYNRGENISGMVNLIHYFDDVMIDNHIGVEGDFLTAEYDILTYVDQVEHAIA